MWWYEVCLKSNRTVHAAWTTFIAAKKSIAFYDVTMSYGFKKQISAFCNNYILFCTFFCQGTSFVTVLWKFDKIKNFWPFFFFGAKDERRKTNQPEISCPSWKNSNWVTEVAKKFMVMACCQELIFLSGTGGSKREERWKMITGVGGHPQAEQMKMSSMWDKRCRAIAVLLLEW